MLDKKKAFKILKLIVIVLVALLIIINAVYIMTACSTRQCFLLNILTVFLLVWALLFWLVVLRYPQKGDKKD